MTSFIKDKINILLVFLYFLILSSFYFINTSASGKVILYLINFIFCFGIYSLLFFRNRDKKDIGLAGILVISALLRLVLIFINPLTTDDHYRYLWDGKIQSEGINPYKYAPNDSALSKYHSDPVYMGVNHPSIKTIYPPLAQLLFLLNDKIEGENITGLKIWYLLFDLLSIFFIYKTAEKLKLSKSGVLLYAFAPLVLFEIFINAHIDVLLIFCLAGSIYFVVSKKINISMLFLGLSVLSKVYSVIFIPLFIIYFYKEGFKFRNVLLSIFFLLIPFSLIIPYESSIVNILETFKSYSTYWYFNNPIYRIPYELFADKIPDTTLRLGLIIFFIASYIFVIVSKRSFTVKIYLTVFFYLLFSHTVHPWYLTVLVLFLPFVFSYSGFFWTGFAALTSLTYYFYLTQNIWQDVKIIMYIEYTILLLLFYFDLRKLLIYKIIDS